MTKAAIWSLIIAATGMVITGLCYFKETFIQLSLAILLFIGIGGMTRWILRKAPNWPIWLAGLLSILAVGCVIGGLALAAGLSAMSFIDNSGGYRQRLDSIISELYYGAGGAGPMPTVRTMIANLDSDAAMSALASALQSVAGSAIFIVVYLGFMFAAAARISGKLNSLYSDPLKREHIRNVITAIRECMEQYLWMQTALSVVLAGASYLTLFALGIDHPMLWASAIFLLNFIPAVGPIVAVAMSTGFAALQTADLGRTFLVALILGALHLIIGHLFRSRLMAKSLNLSNFVVLLALQVWAAIWGLTGAFLAVPLTVMLMLVLAQFRHSRWIAVLLSADGNPSHLAADPSEARETPPLRLHYAPAPFPAEPSLQTT